MNKHNGSVLQNRSTRGMTGCRVLVSALAVCLLLSDMAASGKFGASAMHIMEGYLPAGVLHGVHFAFRFWWLVQSA